MGEGQGEGNQSKYFYPRFTPLSFARSVPAQQQYLPLDGCDDGWTWLNPFPDGNTIKQCSAHRKALSYLVIQAIPTA